MLQPLTYSQNCTWEFHSFSLALHFVFDFASGRPDSVCLELASNHFQIGKIFLIYAVLCFQMVGDVRAFLKTLQSVLRFLLSSPFTIPKMQIKSSCGSSMIFIPSASAILCSITGNLMEDQTLAYSLVLSKYKSCFDSLSMLQSSQLSSPAPSFYLLMF